jgi:ribosome-binding protein aMBF1 (putative translation factor)
MSIKQIIPIWNNPFQEGKVHSVGKSIFSRNHAVLRKLLKDARERAGLSQMELAARLSRTQSFVSKIESGERVLDVIELRELCNALDTSLVDFVRRFDRNVNEGRQ